MRLRIAAAVGSVALLAAACSAGGATPDPASPSVVVTYPILGAVVADLVGARAAVTVLMGNGVDPHDWSPSAKDIERVEKADLVVANGLDLEEGLAKPLAEAEKRGVVVFRATDHVAIRQTAAGPAGDAGAGGDPHLWVDPLAMRDVVLALVPALGSVGIDVADRAAALAGRLVDLDAATRATLAVVPEARRLLVTGHESMGYFADRYGFRLVGAVVPGLTSQGEVAAGQLADLRAAIEAEGVTVIFAEIGTPAAVVEAIGRETGAAVVELPSHTLPADGSYATFIGQIATAIATALR
ncbi:MAG: metal ABC transporter substrate-binding protein [Chloroflexota bacterium]